MNQTGWTLLFDFVVRIGIALVIITRGRGSSSLRWAWLMVVLAIPFAGVLFYLMFGEVWRKRGRLAEHRKIIDEARCLLDPATDDPRVPVMTGTEPANSDDDVWSHLVRNIGGFPVRNGNALRLFGDTANFGDIATAMSVLLDDVRNACASCHLLFFIWLDDSTGTAVGNALIDAVARGVKCRVLVDAHGSKAFLASRLCEQMTDGGVQVVAALPLSRFGVRADHRNHRKIAVIDGAIGWTGSQNVADPAFAVKAAFAPWVDVMVRVEGPAVRDLQALFLEDWQLDTDEPFADLITAAPPPVDGGVSVQIHGTGPTEEFQIVRQLALRAFFSARREVVMTTPYFVPDEATVAGLCAVARSGIRTVLVLPKRNDSRIVGAASRSFYSLLLSAGVHLFEYRPGLLHAKTITVDAERSIITTANLDRRSFELNYELGMVVNDAGFTRELRTLQYDYITQSDTVLRDEWERRPVFHRFSENAARLLAPLL